MITNLRCRRPRGWRRGGAAVALTLLGLVGTTGVADAQVASPAPDRLWGGCQLPQSFSIYALGAFDFLVVYSVDFANDGQPFYTTGETPVLDGYTGPIVCTADGVSIQSFSEAVDIPNSGSPPGNSIDIDPPLLGTAIRYEAGIHGKKQLCHQILDTTECYTVQPGYNGAECNVPGPQYDTIRETILAGLPEIPEAAEQSVEAAVVVAYTLNSSQQPKPCATPTYQLIPTGETLTGTILDAENISAFNYTIKGGARTGKAETRFCHSVADKTDCFRIFKP